MARQNVEIYFKVDGIEEYITDLEQLDNVLKDVRQATTDVTDATAKLDGEDFETLENRVDALDGSVKVLAGSLEIAAGALGALGIENEFFQAVEENAINIIALAEGAINVSEGYKLLAQSGKLAAIQQRILNVVTAANPYVLLATAILAAGAALAAYTIKTKNDAREQEKANKKRREAINLANKQAQQEARRFANSVQLRNISKLTDEEELERIINFNAKQAEAADKRIAEQEKIIQQQQLTAAVTSQAKSEQTKAINDAIAIIEKETEVLNTYTIYVEAAEDRVEELNDAKDAATAASEKSQEQIDKENASIAAQVLALQQLSEVTGNILDEQGELEEELFRANLEERELAFRDLQDDYYRRINLANENEELIAQIEAQYEEDKAALRTKFREEDLEEQKVFADAAVEAQVALEDAKLNAVAAGIQLFSALAGENEKAQNAIFLIDKAAAVAKILVDNAKASVANAAYASSLGPVFGPPYFVKAELARKFNTGAALASIAAATIAKFKSGNASTPPEVPPPSVGGGNLGAASGGGGGLGNFGLDIEGEANITPIGQNNNNQPVIRTYVVAGDVTTAQEADKAIEDLARL